MNKINWIILIGGILLSLTIVLSFISYIPDTKKVNLYLSAWRNAQPQIWFVDEIEYSIDSAGYATFRIYIEDKSDYLDCLWNIQWIPEYMADYLKEVKDEK